MPAPNTAIRPVPKLENDFYDWYARHEEKCRAAEAHAYDVVFIGDSITHLFEWPAENRGKEIWDAEIAPHNALNLGFGWDRTQNVLWRLENGEFANQQPKLVVLLIGTNNLTGTDNARENTPDEIVDAIRTICRTIHEMSAQTHILLMGVLPRGEPGCPFRTAIPAINAQLAAFPAEDARVRFLDIGQRLLQADGTISREIMDDLTHPTTAGYRIWADALLPVLREMK